MNVFDADRKEWISDSSVELNFLEEFVALYKQLSRSEGRQRAISSIIENRDFSFSVGSPGVVFSAKFSLYKSLSNCIVFSSGGRIVLLLQLRSFCDGLIFPESSTYVGRNQESCINRAELMLSLYNSKHKKYGSEYSGESKINGWICNQSMPYHFFYDHAPYVNEYLGKAVADERIITTGKGCFSDISACVEECHLEVMKEIPEITSPGTFNVSISRDNFPDRLYHEAVLREFDNNFCSLSMEKYGYFGKPRGELNHKIKVWVFDTGSKRRWVDRDDFIRRLVRFFSEKFPDTEVLIINDGMTKPFFNHEKTLLDIGGPGGPSKVELLYSKGLDYHFKYVLASSCDIFITDAATSSIVPARFLQRKTLCLVSESGDRANKGHTHHNSKFIPVVKRMYQQESWVLDPFSVDFARVEPSLENAMNEVMCFE